MDHSGKRKGIDSEECDSAHTTGSESIQRMQTMPIASAIPRAVRHRRLPCSILLVLLLTV